MKATRRRRPAAVKKPRQLIRARFGDGEEADLRPSRWTAARLKQREAAAERLAALKRKAPSTAQIVRALERLANLPRDLRSLIDETPASRAVVRVLRVLAPLRLPRLDVEAVLSNALAGPRGRPRIYRVHLPAPASQITLHHLRIASAQGVTRSDVLAALALLWPSRRGHPRSVPLSLLPLVAAYYEARLTHERSGPRDRNRARWSYSAHKRALEATADALGVGVATVRRALRMRSQSASQGGGIPE